MTKTSPNSTEALLGYASSWVDLLNRNTTTTENGSLGTCSSSRENQKHPTKKRRTSYDIRKQQKSDLVAEVAKLENQLELLKHRLLKEHGETNTTIRRTAAANSVLHECAQEQHVAIAGIQGMLVSQMQRNLSTLHPTHDLIQLAANRSERRTTLEAMKKRKLRNARRFITAWSREFDTRSAFSQENRFESINGGFAVVRFDNAPLPGTSVKAAFDAVIYAMQNVDIIISELFGSITIREDTDFSASDISQIRLVSSTPHGATAESNSVVFSEFVDNAEGCYGIVAADFVDSDELYPYLPAERVRRDTTTIVLVQSSQDLVVGTRWTLSKLMRSDLDVSHEGMDELKEISMTWGDTIKKCIVQHLAKEKTA